MGLKQGGGCQLNCVRYRYVSRKRIHPVALTHQTSVTLGDSPLTGLSLLNAT